MTKVECSAPKARYKKLVKLSKWIEHEKSSSFSLFDFIFIFLYFFCGWNIERKLEKVMNLTRNMLLNCFKKWRNLFFLFRHWADDKLWVKKTLCVFSKLKFLLNVYFIFHITDYEREEGKKKVFHSQLETFSHAMHEWKSFISWKNNGLMFIRIV